MTIAINLAVPEGIVFAADSRQTYTNARGDVRVGSDNGRKLFQLGPRAAAVTYGWAFLLGRSIGSHVNDFKVSLGNQQLSVEDMAKGLGQYLTQQYRQSIEQKYGQPVAEDSYAVAALVGGYNEGEKSGQVFEVYAPNGEHYAVRKTNDSPGISWRGQTLVIGRLLKGYDPRLRELPGFTEELGKSLDEAKLDFSVDYWAMPLQDAVDLALFLVRTTIEMQRFSDGINMAPGAPASCGGPIDVAVIEPNDGFRWIQNKSLRGEYATIIGTNSET